ncbi:MAG: hypothetical protein KC731_02275 [Myxococcales bacterium]|nr:hypothetical protein [Myxococcales bacterium]
MSASICEPCEKHGLGIERVRYYPRQLINAADMTAEQEYFRQKLRRHNRYEHGWGVTCGLSVKPHNAVDGAPPWQVVVCPGYALGPQGDEILVPEAVAIDLATGAQTPLDPCADVWPCPPTGRMPSRRNPNVYLAIRYAECDTRPERVHPAGCGCNEAGCEYSRIRDAFELGILWELPKSHVDAAKWDSAWTTTVLAWKNDQTPDAAGVPVLRSPLPVPPCPECPSDPWVVLACIRLPDNPTAPITDAAISYVGRRVLYSVHALRLFLSA